MKRRILGLLTLIGMMTLIIVAAGCASDGAKTATESNQKVTLKIGYLPITHSLPLAVSEKLDGEKFKNLRLELVKFASWPELTEALNSGQLDGAVTMGEIALTSKSKGVPLKFLLFSHREGDNLVVKKDINSVSDLQGKTVGIPHRLSGHNILLYKALKEAGINYSEVNTREIPPPDMMGALSRGEIDGYIVAEPFGTQSVIGGQSKILLKAGDIWPDWVCCGLVLRDEVTKKSPQAVQELVDSLVSSGKFADSNKPEAVKTAVEKFNAKPDLWAKALDNIKFSNLGPDKKDLETLQNSLIEMNLLKEPVNLEEFIDISFAEKANS